MTGPGEQLGGPADQVVLGEVVVALEQHHLLAVRLFLSARTVDNHLARIYAKLGVTSRAELPAAIA